MTQGEGRTRHDHEYAALYGHLGPFGRQDVHLHHCFTPSCGGVLVALGRDCARDAHHVPLTLGVAAGHWSERANEGADLPHTPPEDPHAR